MKKQEKQSLMAMVAELYYINNKGQSEISKLTGISQTKVSRLIAKAREIGMVQITINKPEPRNKELEAELVSKYNLHNVVAIRTWEKQDKVFHYKKIGYFAAPILTDIILKNRIVCLSTSRHISYLAHEIMQQSKIPVSKNKISIVQTQGGLGTTLTNYDSVETGIRLASTLKAKFYQMHAPAVTANKAERDSFMNHTQIQYVLSLMDKADLAIVGVGSIKDSVFIANDSFKHQTPSSLKAKGAVGEICGRFFDADGNECESKYKDCVIGMSLEQLRKTPEVVAVSSGLGRVEAILTLIKTGYIKSLITDEETAEAILKY